MRDDGGPAFPGSGPPDCDECSDHRPGMTMRQWYKGMALMGYNAQGGGWTLDDKRAMAVGDADAMIAEDEEFAKKEEVK